MTFGRYEIGREIGRGAMGVVFEAKEPSLNREVALKVLRMPDAAADPDGHRHAVERFFREGRALASLSHPNIVAVLDMGEREGRCYLVLELVRGTTLRDRIAYQGALPIGEVVRIGIALCQALEHMHGRGIVHRDLKPDNVMLLPDGPVKLTDFGVALAGEGSGFGVQGSDRTDRTDRSDPCDLNPEPRTLNPSIGLHGSPAYMAPEQIQGGKVDGRSDLFSLGVTLYEAAPGRRPFEGETLTALAHQVCHAPPAPAALPPFLEGILSRALAKNPGERYQEAGQLALDLQRRQVSPLYQPPPVSRHPGPPGPAPQLLGDAPAAGGGPWAMGSAPPAPASPGPDATWGSAPNTASSGRRTPSWDLNEPDPSAAPSPPAGNAWQQETVAGPAAAPWFPGTRPVDPRAMPVNTGPVGMYGPTAGAHELYQLYANSSGMGNLAPVPPEVADSWNWGGFALGPIWGIANHVWIATLPLVGLLCPPFMLAGPVLAVLLGLNGNRWAWQNRRWQSVAHFQAVQRAWAGWGFAFFVIEAILFVLLIWALMGMG